MNTQPPCENIPVLIGVSFLLMRRLWNISFLNNALRVCQMDYEPTIGTHFTLFGFKFPLNAPL